MSDYNGIEHAVCIDFFQLNFYRFQIREEKVKKLDVLRKKFEEDKEKIAAMKAQRKFKPF